MNCFSRCQHRLRDCEACKRYYSDLATLFPANGSNSKASTGQDENTVTIYTGKDATLKQVGKQIINSLHAVSLNIGLHATTSLHGKPNNNYDSSYPVFLTIKYLLLFHRL